MKKKLAFTLAEVLITLAIIGIVATLVLPGINKKIQQKIYVTRVKQTYSQLYNAIRLAEADFGDLQSWNLRQNDSYSYANTLKAYKLYIEPYLKGAQICSKTGSGTNHPYWNSGYDANNSACGYVLSGNGINVHFQNGVGVHIIDYQSSHWIMVVDVNGKKKPNTFGNDVFYFTTVAKGKLLPPYIDTPKEDILKGTASTKCTKDKSNRGGSETRQGCSTLLYLNNWEIPKDYPW